MSSAVESCIAATARDLLWVLNGQCLSGTLARDALREAFMVPAEVADEFVGILPDAMRFLAGYGIYICVGTDRVVSRILDALAHAFRSPVQQLIGQFDKSAFAAGRRWCRVGRVSNAVRAAVRALDALRVPHDAWASPGTWEGVLSNAAGVSCQAVATAARRALEQSYQDWDTECTMFARASATGNPPLRTGAARRGKTLGRRWPMPDLPCWMLLYKLVMPCLLMAALPCLGTAGIPPVLVVRSLHSWGPSATAEGIGQTVLPPARRW